jgi:hypothetical protein
MTSSATVRPPHPLDNPARDSLMGAHAHLAERRGGVLRYPLDVSPFISLPPDPGPADWDDVAALVGPGGLVPLSGVISPPPPGWEVVANIPGVQLAGEAVAGAPDAEAIRLGREDGQRLATRLVLAVAAGIRQRGETPFMHASAGNIGAIRLYESLGFRLRRTTDFRSVRVPADLLVG